MGHCYYSSRQIETWRIVMAILSLYLDGKIVQSKEKIMPELIEQFQPQQVIFLGSGDISSALRDSDLDPIIISEKLNSLLWLERIFKSSHDSKKVLS